MRMRVFGGQIRHARMAHIAVVDVLVNVVVVAIVAATAATAVAVVIVVAVVDMLSVWVLVLFMLFCPVCDGGEGKFVGARLAAMAGGDAFRRVVGGEVVAMGCGMLGLAGEDGELVAGMCGGDGELVCVDPRRFSAPPPAPPPNMLERGPPPPTLILAFSASFACIHFSITVGTPPGMGNDTNSTVLAL